MKFAWLAAAVLTSGIFAVEAQGAEPQGWAPFVVADQVADATAKGAQFRSGSDLLVLFCRQQDGAKHFIARWITEYKLGRGGLRGVVYRFDEQHPFAEDWFYTSRNVEGAAAGLWMDPSRRFARRILDSGASRMVFRIKSRDGDIHDIAVPLDDAARGLIRPALDICS